VRPRSNRVKYYISFRLPNGKQRREYVGESPKEAKDAEGKRRAQKREGRIFDMLPESKITFEELTTWYLGLSSVKKLSSYSRIELALKNFNAVLGQYQLIEIKQTDLEEYQIKRQKQGRADATIDMEIKIAQTAVTKAYDNDKISDRCLKAFRKTKRLLKKGSNVRKMTVSIEQYKKLMHHASPHYKAVLTIAFNTGMRLGEIKTLKWSYIDRENNMIRLPADEVKEKEAKNIPMNDNVQDALDALPRGLHHDYVITYMGEPLSNKFSLKKQFPELCKRTNIPYGRKTLNGVTFHDIRRTVKTNMAAAGVSKVYRDTILGHSLKGMDIHYIVPSDDDLTEAMDKYTKWFDDKIHPASVDQMLTTKERKSK
jgi:integrase